MEFFSKKYTNFNINLIKKHIKYFYKNTSYARLLFNKNFWKYALKGALKIVMEEDRKVIRIFGIYLLNRVNYETNKIKIMGK